MHLAIRPSAAGWLVVFHQEQFSEWEIHRKPPASESRPLLSDDSWFQAGLFFLLNPLAI